MSVHPFVRLSNACIVTKQFCSDFYTIWKIIYPSFLRRKMAGGDPFYLNFWVKMTPMERNRWFSVDIRSQRLNRNIKQKSSINTNRNTRFPMSVRWSSYVALKPPKGARKRKTAVFRVKSHFAWSKSATKFLCVKTVSEKVVRHSFAYLSVYKWSVGDVPSTRKFGGYWPTFLQNADFQYIFARSASAVTSSKTVQLTLVKSPLRAFQWA